MSTRKMLLKVEDTHAYLLTYIEAVSEWARGERDDLDPPAEFAQFCAKVMKAASALEELRDELKRTH